MQNDYDEQEERYERNAEDLEWDCELGAAREDIRKIAAAPCKGSIPISVVHPSFGDCQSAEFETERLSSRWGQ